MLVPLNSTMIAVALPDLVEDFDSDLASVTWLVTAYLIAMVVLQPAAGRLGDRLGRGPLVLAGLAGFLAASAGAALAPGLGLLILFRVLQAATGALVIPNGLALVREQTAEGASAARWGRSAPPSRWQPPPVRRSAARSSPPSAGGPSSRSTCRSPLWRSRSARASSRGGARAAPGPRLPGA